MEAFETEKEAALREIFEETGLTAGLIPGFREAVTYRINLISKEVVLFLAETNSEPVIREREIIEHRWVSAQEAKKLLYPEYNKIIDKAERAILP